MKADENFVKRTHRELVSSINVIGGRRTLQVILSRLADYVFDLRFGTDTVEPIEADRLVVDSRSRTQAQRYQPTGTLPFKRLMRLLPLPSDSVLVDFGSGKGRVLLMASMYAFRRVVGVEFSPELCAVARANARRFRARARALARIDIVPCDAKDYPFRDDENVFYFFHPFNEEILSSVLDNAVSSLRRVPRKAWLVYYLPIHRDTIERHEDVFKKEGEYLLSGYECLVYSSGALQDGPRLRDVKGQRPAGHNGT